MNYRFIWPKVAVGNDALLTGMRERYADTRPIGQDSWQELVDRLIEARNAPDVATPEAFSAFLGQTRNKAPEPPPNAYLSPTDNPTMSGQSGSVASSNSAISITGWTAMTPTSRR